MKIEEITPDNTLQDESFIPLEQSGDVVCFVCLHKVNVLKAYQFQCNVGPTAYMHGTCNLDPDTLWKMYERNVLGASKNIQPKLFQ